MHFLDLPPEILTNIIDHVGEVSDVAALEQVCKRMYSLISNASKVLWKHQVENECNRNALFGPSYAHLDTAEDLKECATEGYRLSNALSRAIEDQSSVFMSSRDLEIPQSPLDPKERRDGITHTWLVPGGRFLVIFRKACVEVLDISMDDPAIVETMVLTGVVKADFDRVVYRNVVNSRKFQIIFRTVELESTDSTVLESNEKMTVFVFLEFSATESNSLTVTLKGQLTAVTDERCNFVDVSIHENNVAFLFGDLVVLWNPVENNYKHWAILKNFASSNDFAQILIATGEAIVCISVADVCGYDIPMDVPSTTGDLILCPKLLEDSSLEPTPYDFGFTTHPEILEHIQKDGELFDVELLSQRHLADGMREIFYEVVHFTAVFDSTYPDRLISDRVHHRYKLTLDADLPTEDSTLFHIASLPFLCAEDIEEPSSRRSVNERITTAGFQACSGAPGGRAACALWTSIYYPNGPEGPGVVLGPAYISKNILLEERAPEQTAIIAVPLAFFPEHDHRAEWDMYVTSSMCASSAKIVSWWWNAAEDDDSQGTDCLMLHELMVHDP